MLERGDEAEPGELAAHAGDAILEGGALERLAEEKLVDELGGVRGGVGGDDLSVAELLGGGGGDGLRAKEDPIVAGAGGARGGSGGGGLLERVAAADHLGEVGLVVIVIEPGLGGASGELEGVRGGAAGGLPQLVDARDLGLEDAAAASLGAGEGVVLGDASGDVVGGEGDGEGLVDGEACVGVLELEGEGDGAQLRVRIGRGECIRDAGADVGVDAEDGLSIEDAGGGHPGEGGGLGEAEHLDGVGDLAEAEPEAQAMGSLSESFTLLSNLEFWTWTRKPEPQRSM